MPIQMTDKSLPYMVSYVRYLMQCDTILEVKKLHILTFIFQTLLAVDSEKLISTFWLKLPVFKILIYLLFAYNCFLRFLVC